jgi:hypothetical protein
MLHGTNNLLVQDVMRPLSASGRWSHYATDQFGGLLPLIAVIVAFVVWRHRDAVEGVADVASAHPKDATVLALPTRVA